MAWLGDSPFLHLMVILLIVELAWILWEAAAIVRDRRRVNVRGN